MKMMDEDGKKLEEILEDMLIRDQDMSLRSICARSGGLFKYPSALKVSSRRDIVAEYQRKQAELRSHRPSGRSKRELETERALARDALGDFERREQILVAGMRGAIRVLATTGGFAAWAQAFAGYERALGTMRELDALPNAEIIQLSKGTGDV